MFDNAITLEAEERLNRITDTVILSGRVVNQDEYRSVVGALERRADGVRGAPVFEGFEAAKSKAAEVGLI